MKRKNERGALIVEATVVFPVMFLIVFFMIFTGNAYLQKCRVESIISRNAIAGAAYCADPHLTDAEKLGSNKNEKLPSVDKWDVYPYRYFGSSNSGYAADKAAGVESKIYKEVTELSTGLFSGMKPMMNKGDIHAVYESGIIYATFSVDAIYRIEMPIRMLGDSKNMRLEVSTRVEVPVSDSVEMIRNIDMIWDYMERFGVAEEVEKAKAKLEEALGKVNKWFEG